MGLFGEIDQPHFFIFAYSIYSKIRLKEVY